MSDDKYFIVIKGKRYPVSWEIYTLHESCRKKTSIPGDKKKEVII